MWTKIFRSKSSKCRSHDEGEKISSEFPPSVHRSKFARVVNTLTLKRHGRRGSISKVIIKDFDDLGDSPSLAGFRREAKTDHSSELELPEEPVELDLQLEPCPICTRKFAPATFKKHVVICEKTVTKKRRIFDSSRQRREGTDLADFLPRNFGLPTPKQEPKVVPAEKVIRQVTTPLLPRKEVETVKTMPTTTPPPVLPVKKTTTPVATTNVSSKEKPKPVLSRLVAAAQPCPQCGRSFGTKAYDRHVEWCKEKARISHAQNNSSTSTAKERLQARTKYRAPCLKTKRAVNREKYSGLSCEDSTNSLSDGGSCGSASKSKDYSQDGRGNMDVSMASSIMSSSILSDGIQQKPCVETTSIQKTRSRPEGNKTRYDKFKSDRVAEETTVLNLTYNEPVHETAPSTKASLPNVVNPKTKTKKSSPPQPKAGSRIPTKAQQQSLTKKKDKPSEVTPITSNDSVNENQSLKNPDPQSPSSYKALRTRRIYLTDDEPDGNHENEDLNKPKEDHEEIISNQNQVDSNETDSIFNQQNYLQVTEIQNIQKDSSKNNVKDFIRQRKLDMMKIGNCEDPELKQSPPIKIFYTESCESIKNLHSLTSISDFSSNDLTFSYEEEPISEYDESKNNEQTEISILSPSKSFVIRGFSDKYDPFMSAKRQLEELCSPTDSIPPNTSLPSTPYLKNPPDQLMSKSYTTHTTSSSRKMNTDKSNFHRTFSLRVPRKTTPTRTLFTPATKQKPTIQRGISDEGPISNNFLKPEEYDEMPVKSVCINDFATNRQTEIHSTPKIIKRDPTANRNRRNLKMNLGSLNKKDINPLSKTDSLAIFLQYENATRVTDIPISLNLTEKDLKDKSNNLSKQTSSKSSASDLDSIFTDKDKLCSLKNSLSSLLDPNNSGSDIHLIRDPNPLSVTKKQAIKLEPLPKLLPKPDRLPLESFPISCKESDFIDPKLINVCDNLPITVTKLSDNDLTSSSTESMEKSALQATTRFEVPEKLEESPTNQPVVHRNSTERKNLLKRQLRLGKNQFLYDQSPEMDNYSPERDQLILSASSDSNKYESKSPPLDSVPDEFDIEEFISSFENAEEYPLFKDYKAFLSNRSLNKLSNDSRESSRSPMTSSRHHNDEQDHETEKNEIFSSNESFLKHESETVPFSTPCRPERSSPNRSVNLSDLNDNVFGRNRMISQSDDDDAEDRNEPDLNENLSISHQVEEPENREIFKPNCDTANDLKDCSKPSSLESLEIKKSVSSKQSADSAYGSLSRHSPIDRKSRRSSALKSSMLDTTSDESQLIKTNLLCGMDSKRRSRDLSNDSSSSEVSSNCHKPADREHHPRIQEASVKRDHRMSKFCHECGSKFIVAHAKFCMECGVKRIVLD